MAVAALLRHKNKNSGLVFVIFCDSCVRVRECYGVPCPTGKSMSASRGINEASRAHGIATTDRIRVRRRSHLAPLAPGQLRPLPVNIGAGA
eukprot:3488654-Prymnesium_polylepis.1